MASNDESYRIRANSFQIPSVETNVGETESLIRGHERCRCVEPTTKNANDDMMKADLGVSQTNIPGYLAYKTLRLIKHGLESRKTTDSPLKPWFYLPDNPTSSRFLVGETTNLLVVWYD